MSGAIDNVIRETIQTTIKKTINEAISTSISKSVNDAIGQSIQKSIREQLQKGILKNTDDAIKSSLDDIVKKSLKSDSGIDQLINSNATLKSSLINGNLTKADLISKINTGNVIPSSSLDELLASTKKAGKDMAEVPPKIVDEAENLRKGVGEANIKGDGEIANVNKAVDDIKADPNLSKKANTPEEAKAQADEFVKKNGNKKYKTAAGVILGSVLAAYVYDRMKKKIEPRGIRHLEKISNKELKITYAGDSINFCSGDELNVAVSPANIVVTESGGVNGDYTNFNDLKNNQVKIPTTSNITSTPQAPAPDNQTYGQIKVNTSFLKETACTVGDVIKAAADVTGLSKIFDSIKKFIPWIVGIIILIILFKLWSYFKSSPTSEIKLISPSNARYYYH